MAKLPTAGQVTFHADSLSDLASFFDQQASNAIEALQRKLPIREEAQYKGQVYAWREAATIVRRTVLKGRRKPQPAIESETNKIVAHALRRGARVKAEGQEPNSPWPNQKLMTYAFKAGYDGDSRPVDQVIADFILTNRSKRR
jgi:hypothetical protein